MVEISRIRIQLCDDGGRLVVDCIAAVADGPFLELRRFVTSTQPSTLITACSLQ